MDIFDLIRKHVGQAIKDVYDVEFEGFGVEYPQNEEFGDFAVNAALLLTSKLKKTPFEIAAALADALSLAPIETDIGDHTIPVFKRIYAMQPGFVNFVLSDEFLSTTLRDLSVKKGSLFKGQKVLFEYTDPNPFKVFHIGHLMSNSIGESLSRVYEYLGADLQRVNYQGDVGLHVAKSIWGLLSIFERDGTNLSDLKGLPLGERVTILGQAYALGATAYKEALETVIEEIKEINTLVYVAAQELLIENENWAPVVDYKKYLQTDLKFDYSLIKKIYTLGRLWSLENFEELYAKLGTNFDGYYFESKVGEYGLKIVKQHMDDGIFEKSEAEGKTVIFRGEKLNPHLHTRVFINSYGLPTYEAKDLGLAFLKHEDFKYDKSFIVTANEVSEYFKVVLAAMALVGPDLAQKTTHIGHGIMRFKSGKMSSRTGDVVTGVSLIEGTKKAILEIMDISDENFSPAERASADEKTASNKEGASKKFTREIGEDTAERLAIAAIKYSILKQSPGKDIIFDKENAIALTGDTGPYLLYTFSRMNSVLERAGFTLTGVLVKSLADTGSFAGITDLSIEGLEVPDTRDVMKFVLDDKERDVLRQLSRFDRVILSAVEEVSAHVIAGYLFNLCQKFNSFYASSPILDAETEDKKRLRILLVAKTFMVLKTGLTLLGMPLVSKM